ncbi:hypothetical protein GCM10022254_74860 [Actinomadura meridiana]|uniref:Uncharacterized protein n=1 Tax=Actinomadura meridiana TaxID=559626 RepID=A0ABP8CQV6_9ACTN
MIGEATGLTSQARRSMNIAAYRKTAAERDVVPAYTDTLTRLFTIATATTR